MRCDVALDIYLLRGDAKLRDGIIELGTARHLPRAHITIGSHKTFNRCLEPSIAVWCLLTPFGVSFLCAFCRKFAQSLQALYMSLTDRSKISRLGLVQFHILITPMAGVATPATLLPHPCRLCKRSGSRG